MNIETILENIKGYKQISAAIVALHLKEELNKKEIEDQKNKAVIDILEMKISEVSAFSESVWYFPESQKKSAKTLSYDRFSFDFRKFASIPDSVIFEVKIAILLTMLLPKSELTKGSKKNTKLKTQSVVPGFKGLLRYLNHIFSKISAIFGPDVVADNFSSLQELTRIHFVTYSEGFEATTDVVKSIERAFSFFRAKRISETLFSGRQLQFPRLNQTKALITQTEEDDREKVLPDRVFEKASAISGYIVADFLTKVGFEVADQKSIDLMQNFPFDMGMAELLDIDQVMLDNYTMIRLSAKGYDYDSALRYINNESNIVKSHHAAHSYRIALKAYSGNDRINIEIHKYLDLVYRAACYLIAQYTGMRPSELVEVRLDTPLEYSFGVPCLVSHLKKHQESERVLFDDKWVCIPGMIDALSAARLISKTKANPYLLSKSQTTPFGEEPRHFSATGMKHLLHLYFSVILPDEYEEGTLYPYVLRHTLAYQLFKADLGLPYISHQLKHFGNLVGAFSTAANKGFSVDTLGYGDIGEKLSGSGNKGRGLRHKAEIEAVKAAFDPHANYAGVNGEEHSQRMLRIFEGYQAAGYTEDQIYEAMAEQGMAIANVGTGMCYGGRTEEFDDSLPCIGGLRCNPVRCSNAVVTEAHIPKWREVYIENMKTVESVKEGVSTDHAREAAEEARMVLQSLGAL